jgi:hypothetical protein
MSWTALFTGGTYAGLTFYGVEVQTNDIPKYMIWLRDNVVYYWTKFINKAFGVDLASRQEIIKEALEQAKKEVYNDVREEVVTKGQEYYEAQVDRYKDETAHYIERLYSSFNNASTLEDLNKAKDMLKQSVHVFKLEEKTSRVPSKFIQNGEIPLDPYIEKVSGIIHDMGSYIISILAVGALIGAYLYWKSSSNTGGPDGGNLPPADPNVLRHTWFRGTQQTELHSPGGNWPTNRLPDGIGRRARAALDRRNQALGQTDNIEDTGLMDNIVKPMWKGIKFVFVLAGNAIIGLATMTATEELNTGDTGGNNTSQPQGERADSDHKSTSNDGKNNSRSPSDNTVAKRKGMEIPNSQGSTSTVTQTNVLDVMDNKKVGSQTLATELSTKGKLTSLGDNRYAPLAVHKATGSGSDSESETLIAKLSELIHLNLVHLCL